MDDNNKVQRYLWMAVVVGLLLTFAYDAWQARKKEPAGGTEAAAEVKEG